MPDISLPNPIEFKSGVLRSKGRIASGILHAKAGLLRAGANILAQKANALDKAAQAIPAMSTTMIKTLQSGMGGGGGGGSYGAPAPSYNGGGGGGGDGGKGGGLFSGLKGGGGLFGGLGNKGGGHGVQVGGSEPVHLGEKSVACGRVPHHHGEIATKTIRRKHLQPRV